ncbi:filament-like plant protein 3 isoform X2 [Salvia divinorum]|uniref:Filament-like plant protein 3 isoform X2 n=1 Tax=Salvia divinorum TaxID=28513 RepID=A0ABD1HKT3_SALDI
MIWEFELQQSMHSNSKPKVKQEDLAVAADKLTKCQKTIASLVRQLQSLATLEDFYIDTSSIQGLSRDLSSSDIGELSDSSRSSSSSSPTNYGNFFSLSKSVAEHENNQEIVCRTEISKSTVEGLIHCTLYTKHRIFQLFISSYDDVIYKRVQLYYSRNTLQHCI